MKKNDMPAAIVLALLVLAVVGALTDAARAEEDGGFINRDQLWVFVEDILIVLAIVAFLVCAVIGLAWIAMRNKGKTEEGKAEEK